MMTILASLLLAAGTVELPKASPMPFETEVQIQPTSRDRFILLRRATPQTYRCEASVVEQPAEREQRKRFVVGSFIVAPGEANVTVTHVGDYDYRFSVRIDKAAESARWRLSVERDGKDVNVSTSTVLLQNLQKPLS